jgi:hypothetical protein
MKKIVLIITVLIVATSAFSRTKLPWAYGLSYSEGYSTEKIDISKIDSKFSGSDYLKFNNYKFSVGKRIEFEQFLPKFDVRGRLDYFTYHAKKIINGKCYTGLGGELIISAGSLVNFYGGVTYCSEAQTQLYVLDTTTSTLNPYDSSITKSDGGVSISFDGKSWGLRFLYELQNISVKVSGVDLDGETNFSTQMYGIEFYSKFK